MDLLMGWTNKKAGKRSIEVTQQYRQAGRALGLTIYQHVVGHGDQGNGKHHGNYILLPD